MLKKIMAVALAALAGLLIVLPVQAAKREIRVLSIGHSYSLNSSEYICNIATSQGVELTVGVAYKGNCSLDLHYDFLKKEQIYSADIDSWYQKYFPDGTSSKYTEGYTLKDIIEDEEWDYIIFQQNLNKAGLFESIEADFPKLQKEVDKIVKENQKKEVQYLYHQIWGMEDETHNPASIPLFAYDEYDHDATAMYQMVADASRKAAETFGLRLIPTGDAFQNARQEDAFNGDEGGKLLVTDEWNHASDYGKYLAGATWFESITRIKVDKETVYYPDVLSKEDADILIDCATKAVEDSGVKLTTAHAFPTALFFVVGGIILTGAGVLVWRVKKKQLLLTRN